MIKPYNRLYTFVRPLVKIEVDTYGLTTKDIFFIPKEGSPVYIANNLIQTIAYLVEGTWYVE